jgi:hypothetical protein
LFTQHWYTLKSESPKRDLIVAGTTLKSLLY